MAHTEPEDSDCRPGSTAFDPISIGAGDRAGVGGATPPKPSDHADAIYAAARLLCANGARDGANIDGAVYSYNHAGRYVTEVLDFAAAYTCA